jgi:hypothetical protein
MIFFSLLEYGFFDSSKHSVIPDDAIEITAGERVELLAAQSQGKRISVVSGELVIVPTPVLTAAQLLANSQVVAAKRVEDDRNTAIVQSIISDALGTPYTYSTKAENRQFLNDLVTLGNGGKFTCTDADDVKARRPHTHAQLLTLAHDIEAHISAQFDLYEAKLAKIAQATTQAELDSISAAATPADLDAITW